MKKFINLMLATVYAAVNVLAIGALAPVVVRAHEGEEETKKVAAAETKKEVVYSYVAQSGDSFSKLSRKAVQTYAIKNKIKLSNAKVIAAETWMTQANGSPKLALGEKVQVKEASVKTFVDRAQKLTTTQEAKWNVYTAGVNFNTNAVGQTVRK